MEIVLLSELLVSLVRAIQPVISIIWIISIVLLFARPVITYLDSILIYGKLAAPEVTKQGIFPTRYAWMSYYIMGSLLSISLNLALQDLFLFMFNLQTLRRLFETVFVHKHSKKALMSVQQVIGGHAYYVMASLTMAGSTSQTTDTSILPEQLWQRTFILILYLSAAHIQNLAHRSLAQTRPLVGKYGIPESRLFRIVVCPHYFAEICIYLLFAAIARTPNTVLMATFVIVYLTDSALRTREWYIQTFPPAARKRLATKAVLPFLL